MNVFTILTLQKNDTKFPKDSKSHQSQYTDDVVDLVIIIFGIVVSNKKCLLSLETDIGSESLVQVAIDYL